MVPDPLVTVIGLDGQQRKIPAGQLYDSQTGQAAVHSVLVIDRGSNRQLFIPLDELPAHAQTDARYILVTDYSPEVSESASGPTTK